MIQIPDAVRAHLACPACHGGLQSEPSGYRCGACDLVYPLSADSLDLRPLSPIRRELTVRLEPSLDPDPGLAFAPLATPSSPEVDFGGLSVPEHVSRAFLEHIPRAPGPNALAVELGAGNEAHREVCEHAGYVYAGLDHDPESPIRGDAHALPFANDSVDFLLGVAVLEHLRYPGLAMSEAWRVLRPGRVLLGTVAFLEPFHGNSYYHHTHLGTWNTLREAGFTVEIVAPTPEWPVLKAQAAMGLFPRMPHPLSRALVAPVELLSRLWWWAGSRIAGVDAAQRLMSTSGSFSFLARKPA